MEAHGVPVLPGCGCHLDRGLSDLSAFPLIQRTRLASPEHEHSLPAQRPPHLHGAVAVTSESPCLHHLPAHLPVFPSAGPHHGLLHARLPASEEEEGHGGARQEHLSKEKQGFHEDQRHVNLHSGGVLPLLAPSECLQHGV